MVNLRVHDHAKVARQLRTKIEQLRQQAAVVLVIALASRRVSFAVAGIREIGAEIDPVGDRVYDLHDVGGLPELHNIAQIDIIVLIDIARGGAGNGQHELRMPLMPSLQNMGAMMRPPMMRVRVAMCRHMPAMMILLRDVTVVAREPSVRRTSFKVAGAVTV
jgi:hypothetical protein